MDEAVMLMNMEALTDTEPNKLVCVVTEVGNGVMRLVASPFHDEGVPNLSELTYPLTETLADLIEAAGHGASRFAMGLFEGLDDGSYRATLWRVLSTIGIGVVCMEAVRTKALAMLVSAALCMATPPVFQIGQAHDDRWHLVPAKAVGLEA